MVLSEQSVVVFTGREYPVGLSISCNWRALNKIGWSAIMKVSLLSMKKPSVSITSTGFGITLMRLWAVQMDVRKESASVK